MKPDYSDPEFITFYHHICSPSQRSFRTIYGAYLCWLKWKEVKKWRWS